jgi:molybdenum cofactor sulfurtransferase
LSKWRVVVDAAKFAATHPINLDENPVDFLTLSFYKLFGLPTGLGALIIRKNTANELAKCYWGNKKQGFLLI